MNGKAEFVEEMLAGISLAHGEVRRVGPGGRGVVRSQPGGGVGVVSGGGSGHLPLFLGYVGPGMLSGCAVGEIFASPSQAAIAATARAVDAGRGVLFVYGNYMGDILNFDAAALELEAAGIETRTVVLADDVASAEEREERRGVGGLFFAIKAAGAVADAGGDLDAVARAAGKAGERCASVGAAWSGAQLPTTGALSFTLADGEMDWGVGIHGERGVERKTMVTAREMAWDMVAALAGDLGLARGQSVAALVNTLGSTSLEELYVLYGGVHAALAERGVGVHRALVGPWATCFDMAGASLTLLTLDEELRRWIDAPARPVLANVR